MPVGSVGGAALFNLVASGQTPDLRAQKQQANAQADLLTALMGAQLPEVAAAKLADGAGVDIYM
jgi:hypothetical protein